MANALRLLKLPQKVRNLVAGDELQMGHARALLGLEAEAAIERAAARVVQKQLSVRQTEELVRRERGDVKAQEADDRRPAVDRVDARPRAEAGARVRHQGAPGTEDDAGRQDRDRLSLARSARLDPRQAVR